MTGASETTDSAQLPEVSDPEARRRLWEHAVHEDKLFGDHLEYFVAFQAILFLAGATIEARQMYWGFVPLAALGILLSACWLAILARSASYVAYFAKERLPRSMPEYVRTRQEFSDRHHFLKVGKKTAGVQEFVSIAVPLLVIALWATLLGVFATLYHT